MQKTTGEDLAFDEDFKQVSCTRVRNSTNTIPS